MNTNELIQSAIDNVSTLLNSYNDCNDKRANLLAYWLTDYIHMLKKEATFDPKKLKRYKRGEIIKVHLGYNIGSEEGGLHYAIVLDKKNSPSSDTVTIIPLTSVKPGKRPYYNDVPLGDTIYFQLNEKLSRQETELNDKIAAFASEIIQLQEDVPQGTSEELFATQEDRAKKIASLNDSIAQQEQLRRNNHKVKKEIARMKHGSIALINQITTVSKIRIYDPLYGTDALSNIRLSPQLLDLIDNKIEELYIGKTR